jgi:hypothetical protein
MTCQVELPRAGGARGSKKRKHSQQSDADGDAEMQDAEAAATGTQEGGATPAAEDGSWDFSLLQPRHKNLRDAAAQKKVEDELKQVGGGWPWWLQKPVQGWAAKQNWARQQVWVPAMACSPAPQGEDSTRQCLKCMYCSYGYVCKAM